MGDLNAMYFNSNGDAMGDNYSVMPFALDEELIKKLIKEKTLESDASENSKNNNIMYIDKELTKNKKTK